VPIDLLPVPRLVDVQISPTADIDFAKLRQRLATVLPDARLDDHQSWLARLRGFIVRVEAIIATGIVAVIGLTAVSVIFAANTSLAIHHRVIELLHLLGAGDSYIARQFQIYALRLGLLGGMTGAFAAVLTALVLGSAVQTLQVPGLVLPDINDWRLWVVPIAVGLVAGAVAMATARMTVSASPCANAVSEDAATIAPASLAPCRNSRARSAVAGWCCLVSPCRAERAG
jgi:cell division transport system permease protein